MTEQTLEQIDRDGALHEALAHMHGVSRADFLCRATLGGAAFVAALAFVEDGEAATRRDVDILNYALTLEYVQASFYTEAERIKALTGRAARAARLVGAVERAHVQAFRDVLGTAAVARPLFNFKGVTESQQPFLKTAVAFEDLAVAAYKAQAPRIAQRELLTVAVSIHSVEARHAAWMRRLFGIVPAAKAFDEPLSRPRVERIVASTGFIASSPSTAKTGQEPRYTG